MSIPDIEIPAPVRQKAKVLGVPNWPDQVYCEQSLDRQHGAASQRATGLCRQHN